MKILAFDTANNNNDVAIIENGQILAQHNILENSSQAETLIPSIEKCLKDAQIWYDDLSLITTTRGPGNFTGIRIGFITAKTIKMVSQKPLITINNLEALAYNYINDYQGSILVILDAKLDEFFIEEFIIKDTSLTSKYGEPKLIKATDIGQYIPKENFLTIGSGKNIAQEILQKNNLNNFKISKKNDIIKSANLALLALEKYQKYGQRENEDVLYVRKPNITSSKK
jgi:tRNA threonylcarbamoyladenosine biosynthesis protein TsaB